MQTAVIVPTPELNLVRGRAYHLLLSHLCSEEYCEFYSRETGFKILDNGAHENQSGEGPTRLLSLAEELGVDEIVAPDHLFNADLTVHLTGTSLPQLLAHPKRYRIMVVPQGSSLVSYRRCLFHLLELWEQNRGDDRLTIGISKDYDRFVDLRYLIEEVIRAVDPFKAQIHLLGWEPRIPVHKIAQEFGERIRSIDSAKPAVYALHGISLKTVPLPGYPGRPKSFFSIPFAEPVRHLAQFNIQVFDKWAGGKDESEHS